jgi:hypothetical protein
MALFGMLIAIVLVVCLAGEGPGLMRSLLHGFRWGIGREISPGVVHHLSH